MNGSEHRPAQALYESLKQKREPYLRRARECAEYTIPSLMTHEGRNGSTELHRRYQSVGARGVNNLANKLLLSLMSPNQKWFRLSLTEKVDAELDPAQRAQFEEALSVTEMRVLKEIEAFRSRPALYEAMRQLIVSGNALLYLGDEQARLFRLDRYVVERDGEGNLLTIVTHETIDRSQLPDDVLEQIDEDELSDRPDTDKLSEPEGEKEDDLNLYTHVYRDNDQWKMYQEVEGVRFNESNYGKNRTLDYLPLRWTQLDGEDYGRPHCEEYLGDLMSLEALTRSAVKTAAISAKIIFLVREGSHADPEELIEAEEGEFLEGNPEDITTLQVEKVADLQIVRMMIEAIEQRLGRAFLLGTSIQRNGERVTAEEIRFMAAELEDAFGGPYTLLNIDLQLPFVKTTMERMEKDKRLPPLPDDQVKPTVVTGVDALGRSQELQRLDAFLGGAIQNFGPEALKYINLENYLSRRAAALGVDASGLVRKDEEVQKQQQQQQMQDMIKPAVAPVAGQVAGALANGEANA